jgi:capsular exopolysaccharide synthesis family protein
MNLHADRSNPNGQVALPPVAAPVPYAIEEFEPPPASGTTLGYTAPRVLRALRRRWYLAIPVGLVIAVALGYLADEVIRADYTARTQVAIAIHQPGILADGGGSDLVTYQHRQIALVKSRLVLQTAIDRPGIRDLPAVKNNSDPVGWLEHDLKADFKLSPDLLQVTLNGPDPLELVVLLDAIREAYLEHGVNKETTDKKAALERVRALIEEDKEKLADAHLAVTRKAEVFRAPDATAARHRHQANLTRLSNLQTQLFQLDGTVQGWEQIRTDLEAHPPAKDAAAPIRPADLAAATKLAVEADTDARAARAEIARLEPDVIEYRRVTAKGNSNPKLEEKERDLQQAKERFAAREVAAREEAIRKLAADSGRDYEFRLREHQARVADLTAQIDRTKGQIKSIRAAVTKLDADTLAEARGIAELDRMAARANEIEDRIKVAKTRAETIELELRAPPRAVTQERAIISQVPNPGKKVKLTAAAAVAGFLTGLLGVAFLDLRAGRIDSPEGVDRHLHTGVVGCIPRITPGALTAIARSPGGPAGSAEIAACDAADACRTLLLNALGAGPKVIMVTSAMPGEGKTALSAQLALSLGRVGKRTLLIDGDIRKPGAHSVFGESHGPGLSDVLRKTHSLPNVVRPGPLPTVSLVPAGACNPQEAVSLLQLRLGSLIRKCRPHFDVILIDTPPLLNLPDAMVIGRHADGTILSLMNGVSTLPATQAACARLRTMSLPLLGAVLNGARVNNPLGY